MVFDPSDLPDGRQEAPDDLQTGRVDIAPTPHGDGPAEDALQTPAPPRGGLGLVRSDRLQYRDDVVDRDFVDRLLADLRVGIVADRLVPLSPVFLVAPAGLV
jgi:hypothetical protein